MKRHILNAKHWLLLALMGLLGVSSCTKLMYGSPEEPYQEMYGCPATEYNDSVVNL
jgi:hypothetical protein